MFINLLRNRKIMTYPLRPSINHLSYLHIPKKNYGSDKDKKESKLEINPKLQRDMSFTRIVKYFTPYFTQMKVILIAALGITVVSKTLITCVRICLIP